MNATNDLHTFFSDNLVGESKIMIGHCNCGGDGITHEAFAELDFVNKSKKKHAEFRVSCTAGLSTHTWASITLHPIISRLGSASAAKGTPKKFLGPQIYAWHTFYTMGLGSAQRYASTQTAASSSAANSLETARQNLTLSTPPHTGTPGGAAVHVPQPAAQDLQIVTPAVPGTVTELDGNIVDHTVLDEDSFPWARETTPVKDSGSTPGFEDVSTPPLPNASLEVARQHAGAVMIHHARAFIENHHKEMAADAAVLFGLWATGQSDSFQYTLSAAYLKYANLVLPEYVNNILLPVPVMNGLLVSTRNLWAGWGWGSGQDIINIQRPSQEAALRRRQAQKEAEERQKRRGAGAGC